MGPLSTADKDATQTHLGPVRSEGESDSERRIRSGLQMPRERWDQRALRINERLRYATDDAVVRIREDHAIHSEVWTARGYTVYNADPDAGYDAWDVLCEVDPKFKQTPDYFQTIIKGWLIQRPGIIMPRYAIPGAPPLYAQLRPFKFRELDPAFDTRDYGAVSDGVTFMGHQDAHDHTERMQHAHISQGELHFAPPAPGSREAEERARAAAILDRVLPRENRSSDFDLEDHLEQWHWPEPAPKYAEWHDHPRDFRDHEANPDYTIEHDLARQSYGSYERHRHEKWAKYLYPPMPKTAKQVLAWAPFLEDGAVLPRARAIDIHPLALDLLHAGGFRAFHAMEGLLKNDAILSVGYTVPGTGTPVLNSGSVTLWNDAEVVDEGETEDRPSTAIAAAGELLSRFREIVLVPDSDWLGNDKVGTQASLLKARYGHYAPHSYTYWAAPMPHPSCGDGAIVCHHRVNGRPNPDHKAGVDDHLAWRRPLGRMVAWHESGDTEPVEIAEAEGILDGRVELKHTLHEVFEWCLQHQAITTGMVATGSGGVIARELDATGHRNYHGRPYTKDVVDRAVLRLIERGVLVREYYPDDVNEYGRQRRRIRIVDGYRHLIPRYLDGEPIVTGDLTPRRHRPVR